MLRSVGYIHVGGETAIRYQIYNRWRENTIQLSQPESDLLRYERMTIAFLQNLINAPATGPDPDPDPSPLSVVHL